MDGAHRQARVLPVEVDWQEALLAKQTFVYLVQPGLNHFELLSVGLKGVLHFHRGVHAPREVDHWWGLVEELHLEEEFSFEVAWLNLHLCSELNDVSEHDQLLRVPDEEDFGEKAVSLVVNVGLDEPMEAGLLLFLLDVEQVGILAFMVVWIGVVNPVLVLVEQLKLNEIDSLLNQVHVSEVFKVKNNFRYGSQ